ncbi:MAG: hypothetical protein NTW74_12315 [Acidobacteria bacterium]|nr:hypothetical protein [Acidobacteriota bacterium]
MKKVLAALGSLLLLFAVEMGMDHGLDFVFNPWAYPVMMGPGILGTWKAEFPIGETGPVKAVYRLYHETYRDREPGPDLEGEAYHCSTTHQMAKSSLGGRVSWLGKEVSIDDSSNYEPWGSPVTFVCQYDSDRLTCVMDFSRRLSPRLEKLAKKAGMQLQKEPVRFTMVRAREGEKPEPCPAPLP